MPIYEYLCNDCGHQVEILQKIADAPQTQCPACEQPTLQKRISAAGFRLKGNGWYETDFKNSGKKKAADTSAAPADTKTA
ncbi:MAG: FmdB family zinc ribbon protein [Litorivicinus sp.]